jgi:hypothetical protein
VNVAYLLLGAYLTHRRLLIGIWPRWLLADVGLPLLASLLVMAGGASLLEHWRGTQVSHPAALLWATALAVGAASMALTVSTESRRWLRAWLLGCSDDRGVGHHT